MKRNLKCLTKTFLLVWIACVSTFLGIIVPINIEKQSAWETREAKLLNERLPKPELYHLGNRVSLSYDDIESRYLTPRKYKLNPIEYNITHRGSEKICVTSKPDVLIIVPSIPDHFATRDAIRKTYGSFAANSVYGNKLRNKLNMTISLLFVLGRSKKPFAKVMIDNEERTFGDMVQADFEDTYYNLTKKMLIALKWVSINCPDVKYVVKVDEDVFINLPKLVKLLLHINYPSNGAVYGNLHQHKPVMREGRWAVSVRDFPLLYYPDYVAGNAYVITGNIIPQMAMYSEYLPYLSIEDAYITGCLLGHIKANRVNVPGFTSWFQTVPEPCEFYKDEQYSGNKVDIPLMYRLWAAYVFSDEYCGATT